MLFHSENGILYFAVCAMKIGSRAILRCEPCQVLTEAAVSIRRDVLSAGGFFSVRILALQRMYAILN